MAKSRGGSRGGARGAPAPVEIWLAPEVPLSCQSSLISIKLSIGCVGSSFENQPAQRFLSTTTASAVFSVTVFVPFTGSNVPIQNFKVKKHIMVDVI